MTEPTHLRAVSPPKDDDDERSLPPTTATTGETSRRRRVRRKDEVGPGSRVARVGVLLALAAASAFLLAPRLVRSDLPTDPALVGTPARAFVKADRDYVLIDTQTTEELRAAAGARSRSVWDLDTAHALQDAQVLHKGLVRLAVALEPLRAAAGGTAERGAPAAATQAGEPVRAVLAGELALVGLEAPRDEVWRALTRAVWTAPAVVDRFQARLQEALAAPVVVEQVMLARDVLRGVVVRAVPERPGGEQLRDAQGILDVQAARASVAAAVQQDVVELAGGPAAEAALIGELAGALVRPTLSYNAAESDRRRRSEAEAVPPVVVRARRGELVLRPGEIITPRHRLLTQAMAVQQADNLRTSALVGTGAFVALVCSVVYLFGALRVFRRTLRIRDLTFLAVLLLVELLGIVVADALTPLLQALVPGMSSAAIFLAVPVALGAMTVRLTLPPDVSLLFALVVALVGGVVVEPGIHFSVVAVATSLTGAAGVSRGERRGSMVLAGVGAGLVGALAAVALEVFRGAGAGLDLVWLAAAALTGGALSGALLLVVVPLVEAVFGYVTEPRLYRLADLNRPLLKDLVVHAPGTWHHSVRAAELAEAAARAVGASPLLARTMALYHDVGKMKQPLMFAENQKGDNPHDRMAPEESARVVRSHVADGVKLAQEAGLPRAVIAGIEDHHADNLMESFAGKARAAVEVVGAFDEQPFRYLGRPPQSKEAALVMLADQIEGASRNLGDPTPARLRSLVDALFARAIDDDTLGECDLSLRDLTVAREALTRALLRLHRQELA
ncbi:MAG: HDIG domain-containing protein [Deltaproteobacteria bacterium]|nr:HDIG domain-containing protein [Deltaproteobacteria bacterium]